MKITTHRNKGVALVSAIILMMLLAVTSLGLTMFVVERLRYAVVVSNETKAYYMAQAGVYFGLSRYRKNGQISGVYDAYPDRSVSWQIIDNTDGNYIKINSTGIAPKSGPDMLTKNLTAVYNENSKTLVSLGYTE